MNDSRRDLLLLLPALAAGAAAQEKPAGVLPAKMYHSKEIPYADDPDTKNKKGRRFFRGTTHTGYNLEMHETILGPGTRTHAPHKHENEEIIVIVEGTVETYVEGKTDTLEPGSVIYFASNQMHSARNAGTTPCRYYVVELHGGKG